MSNVEELTCQEFVELVTDYIEDALPPDERARFEQHFAGCTGCDRYLNQMRTTVALTGRLTPEQLDPEAEQVLLHVFRDWKSGR